MQNLQLQINPSLNDIEQLKGKSRKKRLVFSINSLKKFNRNIIGIKMR